MESVISSKMNKEKKQTVNFNASEYAENLSHELLTPLAVIRAKAELLLQSENLKEQDIQHLDDILKTVQRMEKLNRALINLSKLDHQVFKDRSKTDCYEVMADTLERFQEGIRMKKLNIRFKPPKEAFILNTNPNMLDLLFTNLIKNAVNHNTEGGSITIHLDKGVIQVENTTGGKNIPENHFQRFVTGDKNQKSLGLGMAIISKVCEQLKFGINVDHDLENYRITINTKGI